MTTMSSTTRTTLPSQSTLLKKRGMSVTQTYYLAHTARGKLSSEASRSDHNLRLLVGHANLLDSLMLELAEAEQEQESWFNKSVKAAAPQPAPARKTSIQWADAIVEEPEEDWQAEDADSSDDEDSDIEEEDIEMAGTLTLSRVASNAHLTSMAAPQHSSAAVEEEDSDYEEDDEEDYASLSLVRSPSHAASPPELSHDSESDSEDESMPPSPPSASLPTFSEKQRQQIATTSFYDVPTEKQLSASEQASFFDDGYYLPARQELSVSVY